MAESKFLQYQDANGDGLIDVCGELPDVGEEFCPGCIPNPCAITPIWQNRKKWQPYLNEKICKYQITKATWYTTTDPEEHPPPGADIGPESVAPRSTPPPSTQPAAKSGCGVGGPGIGTPTSDPSSAATDEASGGISHEIFDRFADEVVEALLEAYNKDQSDNSKNIIRTYLEYTNWDLPPRPKSRLKLLYSVPYEVLNAIADAEMVEEEEEVDTSDIEVSYSPADLEIKLIRIRKGLDLYNRYLSVFRATQQSNILYLNPEDFGKAKIFNLELYGDRGWGPNASLMASVWSDLKVHIKNKGYYLDASAYRGTKKKVGKIIFTFTYDYKIKKITIYTIACPNDSIVVATAEIGDRYEEYRDPTAMAYLARLVEMENDLIARVPMEWTDFLVKHTYPEVYVSTYPDELFDEGSALGGAADCVKSALAEEGKQLGQDVLNLAFGLGDALAYRFHETLCSCDVEEVRDNQIKMGLGHPGSDYLFITGEELSEFGAESQSAIGRMRGDYASDTIAGAAKVQAYEYVQANPMMFQYLCTWLGGQGLISYTEEVADVFNRLKWCGLFDMMAEVIHCLTGGLTLEEALTSILKATLEGMTVSSFNHLFIGLSPEQQAELDALVKSNLESGNLFEDSSTDMAAAMDGIVGNYNPAPKTSTSSDVWSDFNKAIMDAHAPDQNTREERRNTRQLDRAASAVEAGGDPGTGWQGFKAFIATQKGGEDNLQNPVYNYSGYAGMSESQFESHVEQSRRTLAPSVGGGESWTEYILGDTTQLSDNVVLEAYASALLEMFKDKELELVDKLNTLPGAQLIASIFATTACPRPPFMSPSFSDIIKDYEFPWICGREFVWPEIVFMNPFKQMMNWKDILWILFQVAKQIIKEALEAIIAALLIKLCEIMGNAICQALEVAGDAAAALATGSREGLSNVIKDSICGPNADSETVNQTIVDMVALFGDSGAALADSEAVLEMTAGISSVVTSDELNRLVLGEDSGEGASVIATYLSHEHPEFSALHGVEGVKSMFKNMGNLMPLDFRDNLKRLVDATPINEMMPANPTLCATPEQIEQFCEFRTSLFKDRVNPEQIKKLCDRRVTQDNLEELVKPFQNPDKYIACNMPPLVSDPGCDNGILPFEPDETIAATTSVLSNELEALKSKFSTDMLGNGPFLKNWGMINMILSDTLASPLTVHQRKVNAGWPSANYVDFYQEGPGTTESSGEIWWQKGAYPLWVADWLQRELSNVAVDYISNNELAPDQSFKKDWDEYTINQGSDRISILSLPDFGYNVEVEPDYDGGTVNYVKKARKKTPDLSLLFEDNAKGQKTRGESTFSWGFKLDFYNSDLITERIPVESEVIGDFTEMSHNVLGDMSRIKITTYDNSAAELDKRMSSLAIPSIRKELTTRGDQDDKILEDMKYEFVSMDNALEQVATETITQYPAFLSSFTDAQRYSPPVVLLHEMLESVGSTMSQDGIKDLYDDFMSSTTTALIAEVTAPIDDEGTLPPGFNYGADFDSLTSDEVEYVVDAGQTLSPGGTPYGQAEMTDEDGGTRPIQNQDQILGISQMQWLIKNGQKEGENRIFYLDPITYGGNYMRPPLYIKPLAHKGWLGFVDVLFPELSPCKPQKSDLVDFGEIQDKVSEVYPNIPEDERLLQHPDCAEEWPYARILDRSAVAGLQGLITAAIRIYASAHFVKSMATFTKFAPRFPEVFSSIYASYVVENMEADFKDAQPDVGEAFSTFKDEEFWYAFLEQSVQMYARLLESGDIEGAPSHVMGAIERLNDMMEDYDRPSTDERRDDWDAKETKKTRFQLKGYRAQKILQEVKATEEDAKLILKELVIEQLNYMGKKFMDNLDVVEMVPDIFDLDYYLLENLTQGCDDLDIDHEIKYTYPNLPSEPDPNSNPYYTYGAEFVVAEDIDLHNGYYTGQEYVGEYVVHIDDEGKIVFLAGPVDLGFDLYTNPDTGAEEEGYQQDILAPLVSQTSINIGDVAPYGSVPQGGDTRIFGLEKYIKINNTILDPAAATAQILSSGDLNSNISDVYPGSMKLVEDEDGNPVGVEGELGVRYGVMFSMIINGAKYEITSAEVDALDLPVGEFKTLEANSKLLLCLINLLKEDDKFKLIAKYIFPLSKITAVTAIYNDMAFLPSIGEVSAAKGDTYSRTAPIPNMGYNEKKPGRYVTVETGTTEDAQTYIKDVTVSGNAGWAHIEDRSRKTAFTTYDEWEKELLPKSKRHIKRLFKAYYNSRDFPRFGRGSRPGAAFMAELKGRMTPSPGERLLPWWKRRKLRKNPFNANGELCEK